MKKRSLKVLTALAVLALVPVFLLPYALPRVLSFLRPDIQFRAETTAKTLFLTIDDSPSANTGEILRVLRKHEVKATFFVIADRVKSPEQLADIVASGHSLGNHLRTTKAASKLSLEEFRSDLDACSALLAKSGEAPRRFRPASDFGTREQNAYAAAKGYQPTMGTVFPLDHWISNPRWLTRFARGLAIPGGIVILHDGEIRGRTTADVLDQLIPQLKRDGYVFERLDRATQLTGQRQ
jgi:peptidoglycan-N-acetylglucosamine deacetylase